MLSPGFPATPYKQARPVLWFKQAEGLMDLRNITNPCYRLVLVQCDLSEAQQAVVVHILESKIL